MAHRNSHLKVTRRQALATPAALAVQAAPPPDGRHRLSAAWPSEALAKVLLPRSGWKHFPPAGERTAWRSLSTASRQACIAAGEKALTGSWESLPATLFLEYVRDGNRSRYEAAWNRRRDRLRELAVAECVEGRGRFTDEIVNGLWLTCEETWWGLPAHLSMQKSGPGLPDSAEPVIDLFAAETASLLAWISYLLSPGLDSVSNLVRARVSGELERRILTPFEQRDDFWWMAFKPDASRAVNNWNPWINSNCLTVILLEAAGEARRAGLVNKVLRSLDPFLNYYSDDGGCDEGPGYWGHAGGSLFENLELLRSASSGKIDFFGEPLVKEIGRYIYRAHIAGDYYINFADASGRLNPAAGLIFRYGERINDPAMQQFGAWLARRDPKSVQGGRGSIARQLSTLFAESRMAASPAAAPLLRDTWLAGIQVMAARRQEGSTEGLYLAAQGGHNAESHNHNDVGNFIVYAEGKPAIIDVGVGEYTAKTFSPKRYEIWTMQSAYHNLPVIGGVMQGAGRQYAASGVRYSADDEAAEFNLDLAKAYPAQAGIITWRRTLRLSRRSNSVLLNDQYKLRTAVPIELNLMTPCAVDTSRTGVIQLSAGVDIEYDGNLLAPSVEEIRLDDKKLNAVWGSRLFRIKLALRGASAGGQWEIRFTQSPRR